MHVKFFCLLLLLATCLAGGRVNAADAAASPEGHAVFARWCGDCHAPVSERRKMLAGTYVLQQLYKGTKPAALEQRTDLTRAYVKRIVRTGWNIMPPTRKTEITDQQLDALAAYLASR
jgi:mono/diheme cytochrome c family protein